MTARTTATLIQEIAEWDSTSTPSLTPFINAAHSLVESLCVANGLDEDQATIVETWLAAHFYTIKDMRAASESAGPVSQSFQHKVDLGLDATMYGQQAKMLDTSGQLAIWDKKQKSGQRQRGGVFWLGTELE
jgi:hypothetical protein